ncbi:uncharacterized protein [Haliotis cracherodii]|uniref:uncharacterized protein n=1 Tax=Haliotis cracherodii TaxID=6455 RepID=UPI0039E93981
MERDTVRDTNMESHAVRDSQTWRDINSGKYIQQRTLPDGGHVDARTDSIATKDKRASPMFSTASKKDGRPSAVAMGTTAGAILVVVLLGIVLLDVTTLIRHLGIMKHNFRKILHEGQIEDKDEEKRRGRPKEAKPRRPESKKSFFPVAPMSQMTDGRDMAKSRGKRNSQHRTSYSSRQIMSSVV